MKLVAKTLFGLEKILEKELEEIGATQVQAVNRAVLFEGDKELLYRCNYWLRTALSVLMPIAEFRIKTRDDLYREGLRIKWDKYMGTGDTFSIVPVVNSPVFTHSGYPGLILKDAVADYFRNRSGSRPSVNTTDPDIVINLHISNNSVNVSLDSTVIPLYKRGYRIEQPEAPLNEVLAAGIILMSGWNGSENFLDPMCGSGTFPIEAALIAGKLPPGKFRKHFGFMKWKDYDADLFDSIRSGYNQMNFAPGVKILASDISTKAVQQTIINVEEAGLNEIINVQAEDFKDLRSRDGNEVLFINPPYGLRLQPEEIDQLYSTIGRTLKHNFMGCTAWIITPNKEALKQVGLKAAAKHILFNGALECTLMKYDLYSGSRKTGGQGQKAL